MKKRSLLAVTFFSAVHSYALAAAAICPTISPLAPSGIDNKVAYYDHYIQPALTAISFGKAIIDPTAVTDKAKVVESLYQGYRDRSDTDWMEVVGNIREIYQSTGDLSSLDTATALSLRHDHPLSEKFKKSVNDRKVCISRMSTNTSKFGINFYGATKSICQHMLETFPRPGGSVVLNSVEYDGRDADSCLDDHIVGREGVGRFVPTRLGRNQLTFVFLK